MNMKYARMLREKGEMDDRLYIVKMETLVCAGNHIEAGKRGFAELRKTEHPQVWVTDRGTRRVRVLEGEDIFGQDTGPPRTARG